VKVRVYRRKAQSAWSFPKPKVKNVGGRPRITHRRASERHGKREPLPSGTPVHVTMRIDEDVGYMRKRDQYRAVRRATLQAFAKGLIRIVHLSIQGNHLHAIVEAKSSGELALGMKGFQVSAARHVNRACGRKGRVFADRYHARVITKPLQARRELAYVLNNWRKHGDDRASFARTWIIDPFSTAWRFTGWRENPGGAWAVRAGYRPIPVHEARTWLLREGWRRYGLISTREVPSARPVT
jgi:REP element-mobilizing transposase RayT